MKQDTNNNKPLVSIIVVTYNSAKFVLETLESAKAQTYRNIELIVTDDCSQDNTVEICRKWLDENKGRFVRTELIMAERNTGVPANCNRGVRAAKGEWVKFIAGDDALEVDCVNHFIDFIEKNTQAKVIYSYARYYINDFNENNYIRKWPPAYPSLFVDDKICATEQFGILLKSFMIPAPTVFLNKDVIYSVGLFDERFFVEDFPMWLKLTRAGYKFYFMDKMTIKYRQHYGSISGKNKHEKPIINDAYYKNEQARRVYVYPFMKTDDRLNARYLYAVRVIIDKINLNRKTNFNYRVYCILANTLNPIYLSKGLKSKITKQE